MSDSSPAGSEAAGPQAAGLLSLYDRALPDVYGYLLPRCGDPVLAEDLTAETFLAAVTAVRAGTAVLTTAWLIGIARHKLLDHWRARSREQRQLQAVAAAAGHQEDDPWEERLDALRAQQVLQRLAPRHRAVLVLRYLDDLSVPQVAAELGRTRHAAEALIVRARAAFRLAYEEGSGGDD